MDYAGLVKALDPFWMDVIFELVPASGVFDGEVLSICDEDDWEWAKKHLLHICVLRVSQLTGPRGLVRSSTLRMEYGTQYSRTSARAKGYQCN